MADTGTPEAEPSAKAKTTAPAPRLADLAADLTLGPGREILPFTLLTLITEAGSWAAERAGGIVVVQEEPGLACRRPHRDPGRGRARTDRTA